MATDNHVFLKNGSDLFSRGALERVDRIEAVCEIRFSAQAIFALEAPADIAMTRSDLPVGQNRFVGRKRAKISAVV